MHMIFLENPTHEHRCSIESKDFMQLSLSSTISMHNVEVYDHLATSGGAILSSGGLAEPPSAENHSIYT